MKKIYWWELRKGIGITVCIPGDEHDGIQSKRPAIVLKTHPEFITVQLLSTQPSQHDLDSVVINNKKQYIRPIYLKNITENQISDFWFNFSSRKPFYLNKSSKLMKNIENNKYISNSITLKLDEYLELKKKIVRQTQQLKKQDSYLKIKKLKIENK